MYTKTYGPGTGRCFFDRFSNAAETDQERLPYDQILQAYFDPLKAFVSRVIQFVDEVEYMVFEQYILERYVGEGFPADTP